jgi:hypothetical protein
VPRSSLGPLVHAAFPPSPDPLDAILPPLPGGTAAKERLRPNQEPASTTPSPAHREPPRRPPASAQAQRQEAAQPSSEVAPTLSADSSVPRRRASIRAEIDADLLEDARRVAYWEAGVTLTDLVSDGLRLVTESYRRERGAPYPDREGRVRTGRPLRPTS